MATKADFTEEQWTKIVEAPVSAGLAISLLDMGVVSFIKEFSALTKAVLAAKRDFADKPLVSAVIAEFEAKSSDQNGEGPSQKKTPGQILGELAEVIAVVRSKAPAEEATEFAKFLFGISQQVAAASGSGFLGFGEKISPAEREFLGQLRVALGL